MDIHRFSAAALIVGTEEAIGVSGYFFLMRPGRNTSIGPGGPQGLCAGPKQINSGKSLKTPHRRFQYRRCCWLPRTRLRHCIHISRCLWIPQIGCSRFHSLRRILSPLHCFVGFWKRKSPILDSLIRFGFYFDCSFQRISAV